MHGTKIEHRSLFFEETEAECCQKSRVFPNIGILDPPTTPNPPSKSDKIPYSYIYIRNFHREVRLGDWGLRGRRP